MVYYVLFFSEVGGHITSTTMVYGTQITNKERTSIHGLYNAYKATNINRGGHSVAGSIGRHD